MLELQHRIHLLKSDGLFGQGRMDVTSSISDTQYFIIFSLIKHSILTFHNSILQYNRMGREKVQAKNSKMVNTLSFLQGGDTKEPEIFITSHNFNKKGIVSIWDLERMFVVDQHYLEDPIMSHLTSNRQETQEIILLSLKKGGIRMLDCRTGTMMSGLLIGDSGNGGLGVLRPIWDPLNPYQIIAISSEASLLKWDIRRLSSGMMASSTSYGLKTPPLMDRKIRGISKELSCLQLDLFGYSHLVSHWSDGSISLYPIGLDDSISSPLEPIWQINIGYDLLDGYGASKPSLDGKIYCPSQDGIIGLDCFYKKIISTPTLEYSPSLIRSTNNSCMVMDWNAGIVDIF